MTANQVIYRLSRPLGGLWLARYISRNHPKVFMYHRVSADGRRGSLKIDDFTKQLQEIKNNFHPMSMNELYNAWKRKNIPKNAVVVTFDDGYEDFSKYAFPALQKYGIPVTLFITAGFINNDLWLWPDEIRYAIENSKVDCCTVKGIAETINISKDPEKSWNTIADYCMTIENIKKNDLIENLFNSLKVDRPRCAPSGFKAVSWGDLRYMVDKGLEIGCHSYSHPILTKLDGLELQEELSVSKKIIQSKLGIIPLAFCYPNGQKSDFGKREKIAVENNGYEYAVSAFPSQKPFQDKWSVNRYAANQSYETFEKNVYGLTYVNKIFNHFFLGGRDE